MIMTNYQDSKQIPYHYHMKSNPEVIQGHYSLLPKLMILQANLGEITNNH